MARSSMGHFGVQIWGRLRWRGRGISNGRSWSWIVSGGAGVRESVSGICGARGSVSAGSVTWQGRGRDESEKLAHLANQPTNQPNKHQRFDDQTVRIVDTCGLVYTLASPVFWGSTDLLLMRGGVRRHMGGGGGILRGGVMRRGGGRSRGVSTAVTVISCPSI